MLISVVIPIYLNAQGLTDLIETLVKRESELISAGSNVEFIFVVDGSPDNSLQILQELKSRGKTPKDSKIVNLSRNFGQISALIAGLEMSKGDCSICYSADMQDPSELFLTMHDLYIKGNEIVIATRESRSDGFLWDWSSKIGYALLRREVPEIPHGGFDFFLIGKSARKNLTARAGARRFLQGDILHLGYKPIQVSYPRIKRKHGNSSYTFRKRLGIFTDAFYDSSELPIKFSTRLGFVISIFGFLSAAYVLLSYLNGDSPFNGFAAIASAILVLGGLQLALIGIIGEYIYRIYDISRNRPRYIIESIS